MSPSQPSYDGSEHWMGTGRRKGGVQVDPRLSKHVATRARDETLVTKEKRLAREERRLAKQPPKPKAEPKKGAQGAGGQDG